MVYIHWCIMCMRWLQFESSTPLSSISHLAYGWHSGITGIIPPWLWSRFRMAIRHAVLSISIVIRLTGEPVVERDHFAGCCPAPFPLDSKVVPSQPEQWLSKVVDTERFWMMSGVCFDKIINSLDTTKTLHVKSKVYLIAKLNMLLFDTLRPSEAYVWTF